MSECHSTCSDCEHMKRKTGSRGWLVLQQDSPNSTVIKDQAFPRSAARGTGFIGVSTGSTMIVMDKDRETPKVDEKSSTPHNGVRPSVSGMWILHNLTAQTDSHNNLSALESAASYRRQAPNHISKATNVIELGANELHIGSL